MILLMRQTSVLMRKDIMLMFNPKSAFTTIVRALLLPVILALYMSVIIKVYWPKENYGVGTPHQLLSLPGAMQLAKGGRDTLVFVNGIASGGEIDRVIALIAESIKSSGKNVIILDKEVDLLPTCPSTLQGTTKCFGAVVFNSSPKEGAKGIWNYTLRADASFGVNVDVLKTNNDPDIYQLPLQRAVDAAIAAINTTGDAVPLPRIVNEYPFTSITQEEWKRKITTDIQSATTKYLSIVWYIGFIGVMYQLVGLVAKERETGMSDLIEAMMPNIRRWECQIARLSGHFLAFTIVYAPGFIIMAVIAKIGLFLESSVVDIIVFFILAGLALISFSILGASFFQKAQLSGITNVVLTLCLGIIAQVMIKRMSSVTVAVLGLLFTPMTFVFFLSSISRFEHGQKPLRLASSAPGSPWDLPLWAFWVFFIIQVISYPTIAMYVERWLYGTASHRPKRDVSWQDAEIATPVKLSKVTKVYQKSSMFRAIAWAFGIKLSPVFAVTDFTLTALRGQILVLVGANGCGKTTILNAIAGLNRITEGHISLDGSGGIGLCPQNNVLWNSLTVEQHAKIFCQLKKITAINPAVEVEKLIMQCGLQDKRKSTVRTLSGGQMRKLQLIMMLIGDSRTCCVDEVSGGLDPLSRRRIWDILLAERGTRTFILTTHFLDEAEYLADHITVIDKGFLKAEGTISELKTRLGGGYRISMGPSTEDETKSGRRAAPQVKLPDEFVTIDATTALDKIQAFKNQGINNIQVTGPTIEEVFMKIAITSSHNPNAENDEAINSHNSAAGKIGEKHNVALNAAEDLALLAGHQIGLFYQVCNLFKKRLTILRWKWIGTLTTLLIPILGAGFMSLLIKDFRNPGCAFIDQISISDIQNLSDSLVPQIVVGPQSALTPQKIELLSRMLPNITTGLARSALIQNIKIVNSSEEFLHFTNSNYSTIVPGGFFLGSGEAPETSPTFNYRSDVGVLGIYSAVFIQNTMNVFLSNQTIATQYAVFDVPWPSNTADSLQFATYFGLMMAAYPAFFALYPTAERLRGVRALEYSNGVRSLPLWLAYLAFDGLLVMLISALITIILVTASPNAWFSPGTVFLCLLLYGISSTLLCYVISLAAKSQLSAFAFSAGGQAFMLLMYLTAYMNITVRAPAFETQSQLMLVHYTLGLITPIGQLLRSVFVGLNLFSVLCSGSPPIKATSPGLMPLFGSPILYLIGQSIFFLGILVWSDHDFSSLGWHGATSIIDSENPTTHEPEVLEENDRVSRSNDGLRVLHANKTFRTMAIGWNKVIKDLSFGVKRGEVFALVGPNGAGKSTTISMIRGDVKLDRGSGDILIEDISIIRDRDAARTHLGVCPQQDSLDQMTVIEHLRFYAGVHGLKKIEHSVGSLIHAVGLEPFKDRMASKLSGGNKRKLSLAIALIGNPDVLLLDEPSSGMDPLAKRNMWTTLSRFVPQRSILLTTHSMEEASALSSRVGILSKQMLDIGTTQHLRTKHGYGFHLHLVLKSAPASPPEEMEVVKCWVEEHFRDSVMERRMWNGQLRFNIPSKASPLDIRERAEDTGEDNAAEEMSVGSIFLLLESNKEALGLECYSISISTLDEVFLKVVGKHGVDEENITVPQGRWRALLRGWECFERER